MTFRTTLNNNKLGSGPPARDHSESSAMQVHDLQFKSLAGLRLRDSPVSVRVRRRWKRHRNFQSWWSNRVKMIANHRPGNMADIFRGAGALQTRTNWFTTPAFSAILRRLLRSPWRLSLLAEILEIQWKNWMGTKKELNVLSLSLVKGLMNLKLAQGFLEPKQTTWWPTQKIKWFILEKIFNESWKIMENSRYVWWKIECNPDYLSLFNTTWPATQIKSASHFFKMGCTSRFYYLKFI